ncbi:OpgC domain-containing protein [Ketogulonicigenium vulgare]|nr:OpgC domain-containing protein [Ketogulonicigenium vulgare]ADO42476.1 conserved hypothetical protein [Ketogulonicigenium vulgare Y25]AOZ54389.1 hypothetical protein KVC_1374 [Ketogulonicigenium vulgare]
MRRIEAIDGLRGWLLISMVLSHLVFPDAIWMISLHFRNVMFTESAQGFVFVSGMVFGIVLLKRLQRRGYEAITQQAQHRIAELWRYSVLLVLGLYAMRFALPDGDVLFRSWTGEAPIWDLWRLFGVLTLAYQPTFADILPMYIVFMLFAAPAVRAVSQGRQMQVIVTSATIWIAAQFGVWGWIQAPFNWIFEASDGQGLRMAFNPMGWQLLFMMGLVIGVMLAQQRFDLKAMAPGRAGRLALLAALVLLVLFPLRWLTARGLLPEGAWPFYRVMENRGALGPIFIISFAAVGYLFAWIVACGPRSGSRILRATSAGIAAVLAWRPAVMMGQHSLHTYVWHVPLVYMAFYFGKQLGDPSQGMMTLLALAVFALLPLPAWWRSRTMETRSAPKPVVVKK